MSRRPSQIHSDSSSFRYPSSHHSRRPPQPSSPIEYQPPQPRASTSRLPPYQSSTTDRRAIHQSLRPNPSKRHPNFLTSPGWDPIGDDDALFIQSDDLHRLELNPASQPSSSNRRLNSRLDYSSPQIRKRKRPSVSQHPNLTQNQSSSRVSSTSQSRPPLKYDNEGCSNCHTKQSTCWWKKNKPIFLSDGTEIWGEEKLCNPCSIHWNRNGYHRNVRSKSSQQLHPYRSTDLNPHPSSSRPRRSCLPTSASAAPSSPTASLTKFASNLTHRSARSRSPCPLALDTEREARIVKRSLAKACAKTEALKQKQSMRVSYISEEDDGYFDNLSVLHSPPPSRPAKFHSKKTHLINPKTEPTRTTREKSCSSTRVTQTASTHDLNQCPNVCSESLYPDDQIMSSFSNPPSPAAELDYDHPPDISLRDRTPPPNSHVGTSKQGLEAVNSPRQLFDFDNILSPSFLNASPNSLLRRLSPQRHIADISGDFSHLSASYLSNFSNFSTSITGKVFTPTRSLASPSSIKPVAPVAEPMKKSESTSNPPPLLGSAGLLDAHMHSASTGSHKPSIFSPDRLASSKARDHERQSVGRKLKTRTVATPLSSEIIDSVCGPSKEIRMKKKLSEPHQKSLAIPLTRAISDLGQFEAPQTLSKMRGTNVSMKQTTGQTRAVSRPQKQSKQPMARTIWSRRLESVGVSSEDSQFEGLFPKRVRYRSPSESRPSDTNNRRSTPIERLNEESGLSSAVFRGLNPLLSNDRAFPSTRLIGGGGGSGGSGLGHSEGNQFLSASSPPVLPPPSDCSEGITPYSCEPMSDDVDRETTDPYRPMSIRSNNKPSNTNANTTTTTTSNTTIATHLDLMTHRQVLVGPGSSSELDYDLPIIASLDRELSQLPLTDITPTLNRSINHRSQRSSTLKTPKQDRNEDYDEGHHEEEAEEEFNGLSTEIMRALREAIKAGLSADELTQALRKIDSNRDSEVDYQVDHQSNQLDQNIYKDYRLVKRRGVRLHQGLDDRSSNQDNIDPNLNTITTTPHNNNNNNNNNTNGFILRDFPPILSFDNHHLEIVDKKLRNESEYLFDQNHQELENQQSNHLNRQPTRFDPSSYLIAPNLFLSSNHLSPHDPHCSTTTTTTTTTTTSNTPNLDLNPDPNLILSPNSNTGHHITPNKNKNSNQGDEDDNDEDCDLDKLLDHHALFSDPLPPPPHPPTLNHHHSLNPNLFSDFENLFQS